MLLVHPDGLGSKATNEEINISFDPVPDYSGIAKAAAGGKLFAARVDTADALENTLKKAIEAVEGGQSAVIGELNIAVCFYFSPVLSDSKASNPSYVYLSQRASTFLDSGGLLTGPYRLQSKLGLLVGESHRCCYRSPANTPQAAPCREAINCSPLMMAGDWGESLVTTNHSLKYLSVPSSLFSRYL